MATSDNTIMTWKEMEDKIGKLIPATLSSFKEMFGRPYLANMLSNEVFEDLILKIGVDVQRPSYRGSTHLKYVIPEVKMASIKKLMDFYLEKNKKLKKNQKLTTDEWIARSWRIPLDEIIKRIEDGKYQDLIVDESISEISGRTVYYLDSKKVEDLKINTLPALSKKIEYPKYVTLQLYARLGYIKQPEKYKGTHLWDYDDLLKQLPNALKMAGEKVYVSPRKNLGGTFEELLGDDIMEYVENYLDERRLGTVLIDPWFGNRYGKITDIEQHRIQLHRAIYKIICNRAGIKGYEQVNARNTFRELTEIEMDKFQTIRDAFDVSTVTAKDIEAVRKGINSDNVWYKTATIYLKPFMCYVFRNIEDAVDETNEEEKLEFFNTKKIFKRVVEKLTIAQHEPETRRVKVFLTREENIKIFNYLEGINLTHATAWMISFLAGIRPEELNNIRLEYFRNPLTGQSWLDEEGYLKPDPGIKTYYNQDGTVDESYGYVRLFLPAKATKKQKSQSDTILGTVFVPALVQQINKYLSEELYSVCEKRGYGYLFRRINQNPESKLKSYFTFINDQRKNMPFLSDVQKEWLILKDGRRSMNNMILKGIIDDDNISQMEVLRAAQVQMRHKQRGLTGSISETNYAQTISNEDYVKIISETLEYPIDLVELIKWEIDKGYRSDGDIPSEYADKIKGIAQIKQQFEENTKAAKEPVNDQLVSLIELLEGLQNEFEELNTILLLPTKKQKEKLKSLGQTQASIIEYMSDLEEQINIVKNKITKARKGEL